jgi:hypothetical protein
MGRTALPQARTVTSGSPMDRMARWVARSGASPSLALLPSSNLWFAELLGNQVASNNPQGVFLAQFPLANNPPRVPTGITTGPDKNLWFTEQGPGQIGRVCLQHPIAVATSTATPVGTPIQTATPGTPTPTVKFVAQPTSFDQTYNGTNPLPALTVSLDNTGSNVATPWSASATEQAPQPGAAESWAAASPTSGTVAAGASATLTVTPAADLCARLPNTPTTFMYHVAIHWTAGGGGVTTVTDTVHEQIPG